MSADREQQREENFSGAYDPSSATTRGKKKIVNNSTNNGKIIDNAERERRKKIRSLFSSLQAMLPHVPPQADKVTVVDETINYIRILEKTLKNLEKKKMDRLRSSVSYVGNPGGASREAFIAEKVVSSSSPTNSSSPNNNNNNNPEEVMFETWSSPNVVVNIGGDEAQFSVCSSKNNSLFTNICCVLDKYRIEVLSAHISCDNGRRFWMFQAKVNGNSDGELSAEEIFKQAAADIIQCVS